VSSVGGMKTGRRFLRISGCAFLAALALATSQAQIAQTHELDQPLITTRTDAEVGKAVKPLSRVDLFNGKDLTGWKAVSRTNSAPAETWSVANGVIRCTGKPTGYLRTEKNYRDYRLTVEWRFVKVAPKADNTGVLVHMQLPDQVWPPCVQCQGKHENQGDLFLMAGAESKEHRGLDANTALPKRGPSKEKPAGEWNMCELVCDGNTVKAYVNGTFMNETAECTVSSGFIGFQSEGGEFEIRKVYLEPLPN
jgi:hypothetical protein